ncbi:MAG: monofunctional biosynthetic peptidoglycan transglycosylase [Syntrophales bacterium]|nr:monofunctional biosynthetic peptidoglycan transglycosylase [Syntrophales bacterium]
MKRTFLFILLFLLAAFLLEVGRFSVYPNVARLKKDNPKKTAFMAYRERERLAEGKKARLVQYWVPFAKISSYAVKAVLVAEDDKFWSHEGFDFKAMQKALEKDIRKRSLRAGGSTISQQLAKNLYLSPSKDPVRKLKEAILTWRIERNLSKRRILEVYLNVAEWGEGIFGIEAAARHYYGKTAGELSAREAARLAAVLPNPRRWSPTGNSRYVENRAEHIYGILVKRGVVVPDYEEVMGGIQAVGPSGDAVEDERPVE